MPFTELNAVICGMHPDYPQAFLKTNWIQDSNGFRLHKNVEKNTDSNRINPRIIGKVLFSPNKKFVGKYWASEGLICKGTANCTMLQNKCPVKIKLFYQRESVDIVVVESNHGDNFYEPQRRKIPHYIRSKLREDDQNARIRGKVGVSPFDAFMEFSTTKEKFGHGFLPSKKTIQNILYYARKDKESTDAITDLESIVHNPAVIYPVNSEDYPKACFDGKKLF